MTNRQVTVYWSTTGQSCHAAKEFLSSHGVAFTATNVAEDPAARDELLARTGRMAVPVIMVDDEVIVGFDRGRLQRLLGIGPMTTVRCPDCGEALPVPAGARPGDVIDCPNGAGHSLRLREAAGWWTATIAHTVSCPNCEQVLVLAEAAKAGDRIACCGQAYRLTFEYGAFALEAGWRVGCGATDGSRLAFEDRSSRASPAPHRSPPCVWARSVLAPGPAISTSCCCRCWGPVWCSQPTAPGSHVGGQHEARPHRRRCCRVDRRGALVALLSPAARGHRPRSRQWCLHGGNHAVPVDPDSGWHPRRGDGIRAVCPRTPPVRRAGLPHGGQSPYACVAHRRQRGRRHLHCAGPVSRDDVGSPGAAQRRGRSWRRVRTQDGGHEMRREILPWVTVLLLIILAHAALAATSTVVLAVEGMTGGSGPIAVKRALEGLKGVRRADVSFRTKEARVVFDPAHVTVEQMIEAVGRAGFHASLKTEQTK